jgi:ComF family protein
MAQTMLPPLAIDVLLPVPLAPRRQRSRGFNQAAVLTRDLGAAWRLPVLLDAVQRRRETPHQARLHASARRENLRGAFAVERARAIAGRRVGVVDDVLTTGATLNALAEVLLESGAAAVQGIVLARAASPVRLTG